MNARHYSDEELLAYLDGEVSFPRRARLGGHLRTCWSCRARLSEVEQRIEAVTRLVHADQFPGADRIAEARARFQVWARNYRQTDGRQTASLGWEAAALAAAFCACICLVWLAVGPSRTRPVDPADAVLSRVLAAEQSSGSAAQPSYIYQAVSRGTNAPNLRRTSYLRTRPEPAQQGASFRWEDEGGRQQRIPLHLGADGRFPDGDLSLEELESAVIAWLIAAQESAPLLSSGFARFARLHPIRSSLSLVSDGASATRVIRAVRRGAKSITVFELGFCRDTFAPRFLRVRHSVGARTMEVEVTALPAHGYRSTEPRRETQATRRPPAGPRPAPTAPLSQETRNADDELELDIAYALHRIRACLDEPLEVRRGPDGSFVVHGVVSTPQRRQQVLAALAEFAGHSGVTAALETTQEVLRRLPHDQIQSVPALPARPEPWILPVLESQMPGDATQRRETAVQWIDRALSSVDGILAEAWALRRLADRFGALRREAISPEAARRLESMRNEHLSELNRRRAELGRWLEPLLATMVGGTGDALESTGAPPATQGPSSERVGSLEEVFAAAEALYKSAVALFTDSTPASEHFEATKQVLAALRDLDACLGSAQERLATSSIPAR